MPVQIDLSHNLWDCGCDKESINSIQFMQKAMTYNVTFMRGTSAVSILAATLYSQKNEACMPLP